MSTINGSPVSLKDMTVAGTITADDLVAVDDVTAGDDMFVGDDLAVTGAATIGGTLGVTGQLTNTGLIYATAGVRIGSSDYMYYKTAEGAIVLSAGAQNIPCTVLGTGADNRHMIFCEFTDRTYDFGHTQQTNPTLYGHSANQSQTEWWSLAHDQTDGVLSTGAGVVKIAGATGTHIGTGATAFGSPVAGDLSVAGRFNADGAAKLTGGVLYINEITTPSAIANYGAIYTKSDNQLYFQDGAGTESAVELGASDYGEMGNTASAGEVMQSADEWHAMFHANINASAPHISSGFTFVAGKEGAGNITTAAAGAAININDAAHGLASGDYVTVQSANHVGVGTVTLVDSSNFTVDIAFVGNEAATWQMGSYLLVATAGVYRGAWNASFSQSLNNTQTSIISPFVNVTQSTKAQAARLLSNNSDVGSIGGNGMMSFTAGDRIWFGAQSSAAQSLTFTIRNVSIH